MIISILNLGCKVNQYEGELLSERFLMQGHEVVEYGKYAEAFVINTCAVTAEAERKSRQAIQRCRAINPDAKIFVCGCASQNNTEDFLKDNVVYVGGVARKMEIADSLFSENLYAKFPLPLEYDKTEGTLETFSRTRAYIKIQDGCNSFCSYCIIPYLRGRSRSKPLSLIVEEIRKLSVGGVKEIVLTGINMMQYGIDNSTSLAELVGKLKEFPIRVRLSSFYVDGLNEELLDALYGLKDFCSHFHLSLQSGDNAILRKMNRHYTAEEYARKVDLIRSYDKNAGITTDVIIGFPTETEENHLSSMRFIEKIGFSDIHCFPYSARKGTAAYPLPRVSPDIIKERKKEALELKSRLITSFQRRNLGIEQSVLVEEKKDGFGIGHSKNYLKVYLEGSEKNDVVRVLPKEIYKDGIKGEVIQ